MRYSLLAALPIVLAAPIITPLDSTVIPGKYIVKLKDVTAQGAEEAFKSAVGLLAKQPEHKYELDGFRGFAAEIADDVVEKIAALDTVDYIEKDARVQLSAPVQERAYVTQSGATWGISRVSSRTRGATSYTYDNSAGTGTCSYIIDTGIFTSHSDFGGRASFLANYIDNSNTDGFGHGTHVAGTVGSNTYGVAKRTNLYAVKVLDNTGSGTTSSVIAGVNFVATDVRTRSCPNGAVANMSLGGGRSTSLNSAVASAVSAGVFFAVAAGNSAQDASNSSPASEPTAFTVGATDSSDRFASFSNFGSVVDGVAPGDAILSTWNDGGTNTQRGTSMASPHVAGLAAYLLALEGKKTPAALSARITELSTKNAISSVPSGTVNNLIFNGNPSA